MLYYVASGAAQVSILSEFGNERFKGVQLTVDQSLIGVNTVDILGKRVQRCRSLPSVALRSFSNDKQVSENTTLVVAARMRFYLLVETQ